MNDNTFKIAELFGLKVVGREILSKNYDSTTTRNKYDFNGLVIIKNQSLINITQHSTIIPSEDCDELVAKAVLKCIGEFMAGPIGLNLSGFEVGGEKSSKGWNDFW